MKLVSVAFMLFVVIGFSGCFSKNVETPQQVVLSEEKVNGSNELNEFLDEMEVKEVYDPFNVYNRAMTIFNDGAYEYVFKPVAKGYERIVYKNIRVSVGNFFHNLYFPVRVVNNLLQFKFKNSADETGRFLINSTIGILGLFDPADSEFSLPKHEEDFGQTLGFYGVGAGPHIVLPLWGPSNLRDALSLYPDSLASPFTYSDRDYIAITDSWGEFLVATSVEKINNTSLNMDKYDKLKEDAVDLYPYLRDVYEQYRAKQIEE